MHRYFCICLSFWNIIRQEEEEFNMNNKNKDDVQRTSFGMLEMEEE